MSETTTITFEVPTGKAKSYKSMIRKVIKGGKTAKHFKQEQLTRLMKAREGRYMTRPPYGYRLGDDQRLIVDYEGGTPQHVLAVFLTIAKSRVQPPIADAYYGVPSYTLIHKAFLYYNDRQDVTVDSAFIRAMIRRQTYAGQIVYQRKVQGSCEAIVPKVIFDLVQEISDRKMPLVPPLATARPKDWKERLWHQVMGMYENFLSDADRWFSLPTQPTDPQKVLDFFGIRLKRVYTKRYKRRNEWKIKRGPLDVMSTYSLKP